MNKFITKQGPRLAAFAAGIVLFSFTANAQNLENSATGKVNNTGTGKIVFKAAAGEFQNAAAIGLITNAGVFEMLGANNKFTGTNPLSSTAALRVPGLVSYAAPAITQNIWDGYYTSLDMKNGAPKIFAVGSNNYFVSADYTTAGANRTYTGSTFTYDGSTLGQNVAEENTGNGGGYNNLSFTNAGLKTIAEGDALATGTTTIDATTTGGGLVVNGTVPSSFTSTTTGTFNQVAGAGDISVNAAGVINLNGATNTIGANLSVNSGNLNLGDGTTASATTVTGALNLTDAAGASDLAVNAVATLNVAGGFTNNDQARTNMTFDATSLVDYQDGATSVITTVGTNPYGALEISKNTAINATNSTGTNNNVEIATSFAMTGAANTNFDILGSTTGYLNLTSATAGNVTYSSNQEVVGEFRRTHTSTSGVDYVFNNASMKVNYTTAPATGTYFAVTVDPNGQTEKYVPATDIKRDINLSYDYTAWVATVTAGYQFADVDEDNAWDVSYNESQLRFREGDASADEKVSTGSTYTRVASGAGSLGSVQLAGIQPTTAVVDGLADAEFKSTNDLILRAGPAIWYSVNPGRWSNPATWDEGVEPPTDAEVVIRNNVWAGFERAYDSFATTEAFPAAMATKITIQSPSIAFPTPTLMIGRDATYPAVDFATSTAAVAGITTPGRIIVEAVPAENSPTSLLAGDIDATNKVDYIGGLVIYENSGITASESLINDGVLNIGGTLGIGQ